MTVEEAVKVLEIEAQAAVFPNPLTAMKAIEVVLAEVKKHQTAVGKFAEKLLQHAADEPISKLDRALARIERLEQAAGLDNDRPISAAAAFNRKLGLADGFGEPR